ncbi:MerR family transcriptional regulator [Natronosporangium hydrolyticum]|uniref:MerR family transcriptional regulator n=1 Tax=Natronosporangium hydrolyticum TaxID=2811111 RepID=A0A895YP02_9ACTN|nr:MerR family transcriptional regulator [Natronosporangium hydrolyticum]
MVRVPQSYLSVEGFARRSGVHPELVYRLVRLGLLEARAEPTGDLSFAPEQLRTLARIQRLRCGLALNYAAVGLVMDLLDRVAELEAAARHRRRAALHR